MVWCLVKRSQSDPVCTLFILVHPSVAKQGKLREKERDKTSKTSDSSDYRLQRVQSKLVPQKKVQQRLSNPESCSSSAVSGTFF